MVADVFEKGS